MAWKTFVIVFLGILFSSCETLRTIPLCRLDFESVDWSHTDQTDWASLQLDCNEDGKKSKKLLKNVDQWISMSEESMRKIADKLESCERGE